MFAFEKKNDEESRENKVASYHISLGQKKGRLIVRKIFMINNGKKRRVQ